MVEQPGRDVLLARREARQSQLDVLAYDLLRAAEPGQRREAQGPRPVLSFGIPEAAHHELQIRRLDVPAVATGCRDNAPSGDAHVDLARRDLLENGIDERRLDRDGLRLAGESVVGGDGLHDRRACGRERQVLDSEVVVQDAGEAAPEGVELRECVLANREQEVHSQVGVGDQRRELLRECLRPALVAVVEEVLLRLVEHDVEVAADQVLPQAEGVGERGTGIAGADGAAESARGRLGDRPPQPLDGVVAPAFEEDDREPRLCPWPRGWLRRPA